MRTLVDSSLPAKELQRQVRIAYESAAETAESADDGSKPAQGASLKVQLSARERSMLGTAAGPPGVWSEEGPAGAA